MRSRLARLLFAASVVLAVPAWAQGTAVFAAGGFRAQAPVRSFVEIRSGEMVHQQWDLSCGSAALATILRHHYGEQVTEAEIVTEILQIANPIRVRSQGGFSLLDLKRFAERRGFEAKGYADLTLEDAMAFGPPVVTPVRIKGYDHFVVLRSVLGDRVVLADPAFGHLTMSRARFEEIWLGHIGFVVFGRGEETARGSAPRVERLPFVNERAVGRAVTRGPVAGLRGRLP